MPRIAVFGGTGYLAQLIKRQNKIKKNKYVFFSRKKNHPNYINYLSINKHVNNFKNYDFIIHLVGPNESELKKKKSLIKKKNQITKQICELCLACDIKLIYISSMQIYRDYGINNLSIYSKINLNSYYSKSHYESEKIIMSKFNNHKKKFIILRLGNVFGFKKVEDLKAIKNNLVHLLCFSALKKKEIIINKGYIQRSFIPAQIFTQIIDFILKKNFFKNSIVNIFYKTLNLKEIAQIIAKRFKIIFNFDVNIKINKFFYKKKFIVKKNRNLKLNISNKIFFLEIDSILKKLKKII